MSLILHLAYSLENRASPKGAFSLNCGFLYSDGRDAVENAVLAVVAESLLQW